MARPHIEFVQSQVLPFRKGLYGGSRPDVEMRILSIDVGIKHLAFCRQFS